VGGSPEQIIHSYILRATNHVRTCANYELSKGFVFRPHLCHRRGETGGKVLHTGTP